MNAMVLSAGRGERMLPLTLTMPKPAMPVLGRPLVVQLLCRLGAAGVDRAVLNLHHLPDEIERALDRNAAQADLPELRTVRVEEILGTAGGIRNAAEWLRGRGPILVHNSDFLADIDVAALLRAHAGSGAAATLVLAPPREGYSTVEVDREGCVLSLAGAPRVPPDRVAARRLFTGCHIIGEEVLDRIPPSGASDIVRDVYRELAAEGRLGSFLHRGFWWEFGSPELYLEGSLRLLDLPHGLRRGVGDHDPVRRVRGATAAVGAGVELETGVTLAGRLAFGLASRVCGPGHVEDSIVMPEAWIGPGCRLRRAIVAAGTELPAGFEASGALICQEPSGLAELPEWTTRVGGLLVRTLENRLR